MNQTRLCGADTLVRETLEARTDKGHESAVRTAFTRPLGVLMDVLREIFDESAYKRFLARAQVASSRAAYGDFLREAEVAQARRPRCC
jgi:hypothetical protein